MRILRRLIILGAAFALFALPSAANALTPADLDSSFGTAGSLATGVRVDFDEAILLAQPDGKLLLGYETDTSTAGIRRYNPDGSPDTSFGSGGTVSLPTLGGGTSAGVVRVLRDADGTIYVLGYSRVVGNDHCAIWALNQDGSLKASFNPFGSPPGTLLLGLLGETDNYPADAALAPSGDLIVLSRAVDAGIERIAMRSVHADGGVGFAVMHGPGPFNTFPTSLAITPDGRIGVAGHVLTPYGSQAAIFSFTTGGAQDLTFAEGTGVRVIGPGMGFPAEIKRVLHSGDSYTAVGNTAYVDAISRMSTAGVVDSSVGPFGLFRTIPFGLALSTLSDGIVAAGGSFVAIGNGTNDSVSSDAHILRLTAAGRPDESFAPGGLAKLGAAGLSARSITRQPDGKYVIALTDADSNVSLLRIWGDHPAPQSASVAFSSSLKSRSKASKTRRIRGTAGGTAVTKVELAIQQVDSKLLKKRNRCRYVSNTKGRIKTVRAVSRVCVPGAWLKATGTTSWSLRLKKSLGPGKYLISARATGQLGVGPLVVKKVTLTVR